MDKGLSLFDLFVDKGLEIGARTLEHLWLTGISVLIAVVVGLLLGIFLTRHHRFAGPVIGFANVIQTIPSLALLGFMIPLLGIGALPALLALFLYALLPIIRNTYTGIADVNPAVKEAGKGLGMTDHQLLTKVELPLALPVIFAGIRTATVINVGVATLCAFIGAGGLGEFIFTGIALNNSNLILVGAIPAAVLAILLDLLLGLIQKRIRQWIKPFLLVMLIAFAAVALVEGIGSMEGDQQMLAGLPAEFMERRDGWEGLKEAYGLELDAVQMNAGLMYDAAREGKVDVIGGYSTDGRIQAFNLRVLEDDQHYFPPYYVAPLIRRETLEKHPHLRGILNRLGGLIDDEMMRRLNYQVDELKESPRSVAKAFLEEQGFAIGIERKGEGDILIGGKNFTEQVILAEMFSLLIENNSSLDVELKTGLGGTQIAFGALQAGEIDLYPEYTGTGFLVLLSPDEQTVGEIIRDREAVYRYVRDEFAKQYNLVWLDQLGFNNTYALMMREDEASKLEISSITDLADYQGR